MKNRLWILTCSFLFFNIITIHANELPHEIIELETQLAYVSTDSAKVDLLIELALQYRKYNTQKVFEYATKAFNLSSKIGYEKGIAASNNRLGSFYRQTGIYDKAIDYYLKALKYYEKVDDKRGISFCSNGIGNILRVQQFYDRAIEYQQRALDIAIEQKDSVGMSIYYRNLGTCYSGLGDYDRALLLNQKSLDIIGNTGYTSVRIANFQAIGTSYYKLGNLPKAIYYYSMALTLGEETSDFYSMTHTLNQLASCFVDQHDLAKAEQYYKRSIELAKEMGVKFDIRDAYIGLSNLYEERGKFEMAYKNLKFYTDYNDSLFTIENVQKTSQLEQVFGMEQQEMKIELLTKNNELNEIKIIKQRNISYSFIAFLFLFLVFIIFLLRLNKRVQKSNLMLKLVNEEINKRNYEIELQAQELRKLSIVAGKTTNAIMIIKPNGDIDWVNDAFTKIYGYTLEEFIAERGKNLIGVSPDIEIRHNIERAIYYKESVTYSVLVPCLNKSQMWIQTTISPIFNSDGSIQCFVAIDTDITRSKEFEINLVQMSDELVSSASDLERKNAQILKQRDDLAQLNAELSQKNEEIQSQHDYVMIMNNELKDKNAEIEHQRDALTKAQDQILQSEKMASLGVLTAGIAHEINNPINFVYAGSNILKRDYEDIGFIINELIAFDSISGDSNLFVKNMMAVRDKIDLEEIDSIIKQTISDIQIGARRIADIVEGLRNYSKVEKEAWVAKDIHVLIDGVLLLLKNSYRDRIEIEKNYTEHDATIQCKVGRIDQALLNILGNAVDAINSKGRISIITKLHKAMLVIQICDTGIGMPADIINKIFDPFYTTKPVGKGMGLGLSIAYGIISEHRGSIKVNSQVGVGTEFILELPLTQSADT